MKNYEIKSNLSLYMTVEEDTHWYKKDIIHPISHKLNVHICIFGQAM